MDDCVAAVSLEGRKTAAYGGQARGSDDEAAAYRAGNADRPCEDPGSQDGERHAAPAAWAAADPGADAACSYSPACVTEWEGYTSLT